MRHLKLTSLFTGLIVSTSINAAPISQLTITGGDYSLGNGSKNTFINMDGTPGVGAFADLTIGGYDGSSPQSNTWTDWGIAYLEFDSNGPIVVMTAPEDDYTSSTADPDNASFAGISGDITNDIVTLDLSSWSMWWSGTITNEGPGDTCVTADFVTRCSTPLVINSYDPSTGAFDATWNSVIVGAWCNGCLSNWHITGTVSAVPLPAAVWLFGSGLIALFAASRKRRH